MCCVCSANAVVMQFLCVSMQMFSLHVLPKQMQCSFDAVLMQFRCTCSVCLCCKCRAMQFRCSFDAVSMQIRCTYSVYIRRVCIPNAVAMQLWCSFDAVLMHSRKDMLQLMDVEMPKLNHVLRWWDTCMQTWLVFNVCMFVVNTYDDIVSFMHNTLSCQRNYPTAAFCRLLRSGSSWVAWARWFANGRKPLEAVRDSLMPGRKLALCRSCLERCGSCLERCMSCLERCMSCLERCRSWALEM